MKRRIRKLKSPVFLEIEITDRELEVLAKSLGLDLFFHKDGSWIVTPDADEKINRAAGMMLMDGLRVWKNRGDI